MSTRIGPRWVSSIGAIVFVLALGACGASMDEKSGGDELRGSAGEIPVNQPADDRVSAEQGDHTDWKAFALEAAATVKLEIWWDNPQVAANVALFDQFGTAQGRLNHRKGQRKDILGPVPLGEGSWFVRVQATEGASVYTVEVTTSDAPRKGSGSGGRPEF